MGKAMQNHGWCLVKPSPFCFSQTPCPPVLWLLSTAKGCVTPGGIGLSTVHNTTLFCKPFCGLFRYHHVFGYWWDLNFHQLMGAGGRAPGYWKRQKATSAFHQVMNTSDQAMPDCHCQKRLFQKLWMLMASSITMCCSLSRHCCLSRKHMNCPKDQSIHAG